MNIGIIVFCLRASLKRYIEESISPATMISVSELEAWAKIDAKEETMNITQSLRRMLKLFIKPYNEVILKINPIKLKLLNASICLVKSITHVYKISEFIGNARFLI